MGRARPPGGRLARTGRVGGLSLAHLPIRAGLAVPALIVTSLAFLGIVRLLPVEGVGLWLRLLVATVVALLPGALIGRAIGERGLAGATVWSVVAIGVALVLAFLWHTTIDPGLWLIAVCSLLLLPFGLKAPRPQQRRRRYDPLIWVAAVGLLLGFAIWMASGIPAGDQLFHMARVRKLVVLDGLSLHRLDEFRDGGLHPGYAFPLWHGFLALVSRLAGTDPAVVIRYEASILAPIAALIGYEAGTAVFRSRILGAAVMLASLVPAAFAGGHGGALVSLAEPGTAAKWLLVPAVIGFFFRALEYPTRGGLASLAVATAGLTLIHPTYAVFLLVGLGGFAAALTLTLRRDWYRLLRPLTMATLPVGLVLVWLRPIAQQAAAHNPGPTVLARGLARYHHELVISDSHRYALSPQVFARTGAFAIAALVLLPLAGAATARRWSSFILGTSLALFPLLLLKPLFPSFANLVSLSQARRAVGFVPLPYAFVGGVAILSALIGRLVVVCGLVAGIALQHTYAGDFSATFAHGAPPLPVWIAFIGAAAALVLRTWRRRLPRIKARRLWVLAATILFLVPIVVHGLMHWAPAVERDRYALTPGLVAALDQRVPRKAVVFSDLETSYRISAYAPVYVAAAPPAHVAETKANDPFRRRMDVLAFYRTGDLSTPRHYHATWLVVDRSRFRLRPALPVIYQDYRFTLYELASRSNR